MGELGPLVFPLFYDPVVVNPSKMVKHVPSGTIIDFDGRESVQESKEHWACGPTIFWDQAADGAAETIFGAKYTGSVLDRPPTLSPLVSHYPVEDFLAVHWGLV